MRERRPIPSPSSQPSRVLRTTACLAADGVNPSSRSEPISAWSHTPSGRGSRNSPSTVSSVDRAAGAPTDRRRRTSSTGGTLVDASGTTAHRPTAATVVPAGARRGTGIPGVRGCPPGAGRGGRGPSECVVVSDRLLPSFAMTDLALLGGTVADVYTGTWIKANVEIEDGVITYVGPRAPERDAIDVTGKVLTPG